MVGAIVLAAGAATRMGRQKLLLPFAGRTVIAHIVAQLGDAGVSDVVVVTGADGPDVAAALAGLDVAIAPNDDYRRGMLSSVRTGLLAAPAGWTAALLTLGDQPLISSRVVRALLDAHFASASNIVTPVFEGRRGHPIVLPREFWHEALTDHDDVGLRGVLRAHSREILEIDVDSEDILSDMDTPEDYRNALARMSQRGRPA